MKFKNILAKIGDATNKVTRFVDVKTLALAAAVGSILTSAVPARATGDIDDLFAALNVTGLSGNVKTVLLAGVGVMLLFLGYRMLKRGSSHF